MDKDFGLEDAIEPIKRQETTSFIDALAPDDLERQDKDQSSDKSF